MNPMTWNSEIWAAADLPVESVKQLKNSFYRPWHNLQINQMRAIVLIGSSNSRIDIWMISIIKLISPGTCVCKGATEETMKDDKWFTAVQTVANYSK
jgi:hypothetical protein